MFTGIVDHCGEILSVEKASNRAKIWFECQFDNFQLGESIAIDGGCLTVVDTQQNAFACELSPETMRLTISQNYDKGQRVNLERALQMSDRLGGHLVSGHVDQMIAVESLHPHDKFLEMRFEGVNSNNHPYLVQKGSVAVNGVSLTVNAVTENGFSVMLIPHTLERTNLKALTAGQHVNVEFDLVAKMLSKQLQPYLNKLKKEVM